MQKELTENDIENQLSTKDLIHLDNSVQDIKQGVDDALSNDLKIGTRDKDISDGIKELKFYTDKFKLPKLYKNVVSLVDGYYLDDLYSVEDDFFVKVGKRPDHPDGWVC